MIQRADEKALDFIIQDMIGVVEKSKDEIFFISEESRKEHDLLQEELQVTREKVAVHIDKGDKLEEKVKISRRRLSQVSKEFYKYSEDEIRDVYETTLNMQTELALLRQEEKALRERRDELERRLLTLKETVDRATGLASKVSVILTYLNDDFQHVNDLIKDARDKKAFSLKIIEAQEEERKRISRELHDGPAQMLANILLRSELVVRAFKDKSMEKAQDEINSVRRLIRSSLHEVRHIIYDLRPMALDDLGLMPTLKKYISTAVDYHQINIEFTAIGEERRLSQKYEIALFRLVQESLQNAIKHAEASLIKVKVEIGEQTLAIVVDDNGKGFDKEAILDNSFGIMGMKERVQMLDGKIAIQSKEGKGTKVLINVPYEQKALV